MEATEGMQENQVIVYSGARGWEVFLETLGGGTSLNPYPIEDQNLVIFLRPYA